MAKEICGDPGDHESDELANAPRQIDSRTLFGKSRILTIRHGEEIYTLRITRAEKLILTK
jgi:hemin uptake protein HemP